MRVIRAPVELKAAGTVEKSIFEYVGQQCGEDDISVARMVSPAGWSEPGQAPAFNEITVVLRGVLRVDTREGTEFIRAGEAVMAEKGEWVRYSTPEEPAEYVAICTPAFTQERVNRATARRSGSSKDNVISVTVQASCDET